MELSGNGKRYENDSQAIDVVNNMESDKIVYYLFINLLSRIININDRCSSV